MHSAARPDAMARAILVVSGKAYALPNQDEAGVYCDSAASGFVRRARWLVAESGRNDVRLGIRLLIAAILTIGTAACRERNGAASKVERFPNAANQSCFADSGSDRWSLSGPLHLARVAVESEATFDVGVGGSALGLYLFDYGMGRVVVTDSMGRTTGAFARAGHGPGEILPVEGISRLTPTGRRAAWIDVSHDTVSVLDGMTVHWCLGSPRRMHRGIGRWVSQNVCATRWGRCNRHHRDTAR